MSKTLAGVVNCSMRGWGGGGLQGLCYKARFFVVVVVVVILGLTAPSPVCHPPSRQKQTAPHALHKYEHPSLLRSWPAVRLQRLTWCCNLPARVSLYGRQEGEISATEIRERPTAVHMSGTCVAESVDESDEHAVSRGLIDVHYGSVAEKALQLQPAELLVPKHAQKEFEETSPTKT